MKRFNTFICLVALSTAFFGCSEDCDEPDIAAINALYFELDRGPDGFSEEALDEVFIVRIIPFSDPLVADTVFLQGNFPSGRGRFFINDEFPFVNTQSPYFTIYNYLVVDPTTSFGANIETIELEGEYDGDCGYNNIAKRFTYNGVEMDMGGSQEFFLITP